MVGYPSFTKNLPTDPLTFWRMSGEGFPEGTKWEVLRTWRFPHQPFVLSYEPSNVLLVLL
jgi:hypothetical protein